MGIQLFEHAPDGPFDDGFHLHIVDVKAGQIAIDPGQFLKLEHLFLLLLRRQGPYAEEHDGKKQFSHGFRRSIKVDQ